MCDAFVLVLCVSRGRLERLRETTHRCARAHTSGGPHIVGIGVGTRGSAGLTQRRALSRWRTSVGRAARAMSLRGARMLLHDADAGMRGGKVQLGCGLSDP